MDSIHMFYEMHLRRQVLNVIYHRQTNGYLHHDN